MIQGIRRDGGTYELVELHPDGFTDDGRPMHCVPDSLLQHMPDLEQALHAQLGLVRGTTLTRFGLILAWGFVHETPAP
jgi:hypothetical protein